MLTKSTVTVLCLGAAMVIASCGATPEQTATEPADPAPINDLRNRYVAAYNAGDAAALAALYTEDAVSMPDHRPAVEGRAAIERYYAELFAQYTPNISITPGDTEISGDFAHENGTFSVTLAPKGEGPAMTESGKYLVILEREADGWRIHHDIDNSNTPPPGVPGQTSQP